MSGIGMGRVPSQWLPRPLLYQDGASRVGSAIDRSGATVETSVVSAQGPHSSAWHGCYECPLGYGTFGLGSPGMCSGKEPKVPFLMCLRLRLALSCFPHHTGPSMLETCRVLACELRH